MRGRLTYMRSCGRGETAGYGRCTDRHTGIADTMTFGTIFFIIVAAIVLFQLRNVLGRRTGSERPPFDPYTRPEKTIEPQGNVVTLPSRRETGVTDAVVVDRYAAIDKIVPVAEPANAELRRIQDADPTFDAKAFIDGVKIAYEMIVTAFAAGDRKTLKSLLSAEAYSGFESAITDRESRSEKWNPPLSASTTPSLSRPRPRTARS